MMAMTPEEFADHVLREAKPPTSFRPVADYDADGDCIEFIFHPDSFYGEYIDGAVTVYRSQETNDVVGGLIKGISRLCRQLTEKLPGFANEMHNGRVPLGHLLLARLWLRPAPCGNAAASAYKLLAKAAQEAQAEVDVRSAA